MVADRGNGDDDFWRDERSQWLVRHGIAPRSAEWKQKLSQLDSALLNEFYRHFSQRWHDELDAGHGACLRAKPELAAEVRDSLLKFDGDRYEMLDFVVMPNHVHLLAAFAEEDALLEQCDSWKHFTARQINRLCGTSGRFWQQDGFDHPVRSADQFQHFRRYIAGNPEKAGLKPGQSIHYSKPLSQSSHLAPPR